MFKYSLVENLLTERPDDYSAQAHSVASLDKEAIITRMLNRGTLLTRTDILAVLNGFEETVAAAILDGNSVNLPLFNTAFSISGVFETPLDTFDGNRHKLNINLTKGILLRDVERKVKFEKTTNPTPLPQIQELRDSVSGTVNEKLTANGVVELRGYNLKIDGDLPACGLWFVSDSGAEIKAEVIIENKPSKIIAMIPPLSDGNYQVKVVTQYTGGGKFLKIPKMFIYPKSLSIKN
jgi:nucleoid DNA-binding protein